MSSILVLGDYAGERLNLEVVLYGSCVLIKIPTFSCKVPLCCVSYGKITAQVNWDTEGL